jgi:hypothetical protein
MHQVYQIPLPVFAEEVGKAHVFIVHEEMEKSGFFKSANL